jgi:hypothetical protein
MDIKRIKDECQCVHKATCIRIVELLKQDKVDEAIEIM